MRSMKKLAASVVMGLGLIGFMAGCRSTAAPAPICTVEGCVERSGPTEIGGGFDTAFEVVMRAGPIDGRSDLTRVRLVRQTAGEELTMQLNLAEMAASGDSTFNVLIQPGDVLTVPELAR
jgi:protein involved in polysaccharide export with SLBB domain